MEKHMIILCFKITRKMVVYLINSVGKVGHPCGRNKMKYSHHKINFNKSKI